MRNTTSRSHHFQKKSVDPSDPDGGHWGFSQNDPARRARSERARHPGACRPPPITPHDTQTHARRRVSAGGCSSGRGSRGPGGCRGRGALAPALPRAGPAAGNRARCGVFYSSPRPAWVFRGPGPRPDFGRSSWSPRGTCLYPSPWRLERNELMTENFPASRRETSCIHVVTRGHVDLRAGQAHDRAGIQFRHRKSLPRSDCRDPGWLMMAPVRQRPFLIRRPQSPKSNFD